MPRTKPGFALGLTAIALAGFALRVAFVVFSRVQHLPLRLGDAAFYSRGANLLADGRGFIDPFMLPNVRAAAGHPPLYMLWLAIPSWIWPGHTATPTVHMLWSCILGAGTVVLCGLAGREMDRPRAGLIAAGLAAVYPNIWVHDGMLLSETAALFTTAAVLLFAYRFARRPTGWGVLWLGLWCGLAGLARPELVLTLPLVLAPVVLLRRTLPARRRMLLLAGGAAATILVLAPWVGYNLSRFERPVYISDNFGSTLAAANCRATYYGTNIGFKSYECANAAGNRARRTHPHWLKFDESERDFVLRQAAVRYVRAHGDRVPIVVAARWARVAGLYEPFEEAKLNRYLLDQPSWLGYLLVYSYYAVVVLAIAGVVVMRRRRIAVWPLLAIVAIVLTSVAVTFAQTRYRAPAEIALVLAAAVALDAAFERVQTSRSPAELATTPDPELVRP